MTTDSPLRQTAAALRARTDIEADYIDGFVWRHRDALLRQLRPVARRVLLVGCGDRKVEQEGQVEARALYTGSLTQAAIRHAERTGHPWFIVSAHYALLEPDQAVRGYNLRVTELDRQQRALWAERVAGWLRRLVPKARVVEAHAGEDYLRLLRAPLAAQGFHVETPLGVLNEVVAVVGWDA